MTDVDPSYERLVENAPVGVFQVDVDPEQLDDADIEPAAIYVNETLADMLSFDSPDHLRAEVSAVEHADPDDEAEFRERLEETGHVEAFESALIARDGDPVEVLLSGALKDGELSGYVTDITNKKRLERKAEEQAEALLEQSMPIVQIWEGITLATVVGTLDTNRAQQLTEELLDELTAQESSVALVDITGVPDVDTATAQHLIDTVNAVSLLGSEVIITGINPEIAQTLVQLGITMNEIRTKSTLSAGLELALQMLPDDVSASEEAR